MAKGDEEAARVDAEAALMFGQSNGSPLLEYLGHLGAGNVEEAMAVADEWSFGTWAQLVQ